MALPLDLVTKLQQEPPEPAWKDIVEYAWEVCSKPLPENNAETEITNRDRAIGDLDHFFATAGWDLWLSFEAAVPKTSTALAEWWHKRSHGRAILILDGLSLRETPWILAQAEARGFSTKRAFVTGAELPAETTAFAKALGFGQRSSLGNNGAGGSHKLTGAKTETADIPWLDCAEMIGAEPDWVFWHQWPDHRLHDHDDPGKGLSSLISEIHEHVLGDDFWSLVSRLATGRDLVITSDHGYASSGHFTDSEKDQTDYLKNRYKSGRAIPSSDPAGAWVPPIDLSIPSAHGTYLYVNGRRKWKSAGGYPTLTHGGITVLETLVPFIELERK